jgi:hypothetical protein
MEEGNTTGKYLEIWNILRVDLFKKFYFVSEKNLLVTEADFYSVLETEEERKLFGHKKNSVSVGNADFISKEPLLEGA